MMDDELARRNLTVLQVTQALVGGITSHMKSIAVDVIEDRVVLHYAMAEMDEVDREVIDDTMFELDVLLDGHVLIESEAHVGISPEDWVRRKPDRVYQAYEWTQDAGE
jgi:hypothetical protein